MNNRRLTSDLIADPSLWRLILRVSPSRLHALLLGPMSADRSVIAHSEPLADSSLKALENAIYDNPLILSDFESVSLIISTSQLAQCPAGLDAIHEDIARAMLPDSESPRRLIASPMTSAGDSLLALVDSEKANFLMRSFPDAEISLDMAVAARRIAYLNQSRGDSAHLYSLCRPHETLIFLFNGSGVLTFANRFDAASAADCAYFTLAVAGSENPPMSIGGDPDLRNSVCEILRSASPAAEILPLTLPQSLLSIRSQAPDIPDDMLFITEL